jgi:hypothetical protein
MYLYNVQQEVGGRGSDCVERTKYGAGRWARTTKGEKWGRHVGQDIQGGKVGQAGGLGYQEEKVGQADATGHPGGKSGAGRWVKIFRRKKWGKQM